MKPIKDWRDVIKELRDGRHPGSAIWLAMEMLERINGTLRFVRSEECSPNNPEFRIRGAYDRLAYDHPFEPVPPYRFIDDPDIEDRIACRRSSQAREVLHKGFKLLRKEFEDRRVNLHLLPREVGGRQDVVTITVDSELVVGLDGITAGGMRLRLEAMRHKDDVGCHSGVFEGEQEFSLGSLQSNVHREQKRLNKSKKRLEEKKKQEAIQGSSHPKLSDQKVG